MICDSVCDTGSFGTSEFFAEQLQRLNANQSEKLNELEDYQNDIEGVQIRMDGILKKIIVKNTAIHKVNLYSEQMQELNR